MDLTHWESPNPGLLHVPSDDAEWGSILVGTPAPPMMDRS